MSALEQQIAREQHDYEQPEEETPELDDEPDATPGDEPETDEEPVHAPPTGRALFDASAYETEALALPKIDGEGVDKIGARFAGRVFLDRGNEADVALIRSVKLGQTVTLMVEAEVGPPVPGYSTNRDGDLDSLYLGRTFKITSVYRPTPQEL